MEFEEYKRISDVPSGSVQNDSLNAAPSVGSQQQQQQDWSLIWECFDNPQTLLTNSSGGLSKGMQEMVKNAMAEMRRYYSRKVVDVLIKVTRQSLDCVRKRFLTDELQGKIKILKEASTNDSGLMEKNFLWSDSDAERRPKPKPVFLINAVLMIPNVAIKPTLDEIQETLITAGRNITCVSKGVGQWTGGKAPGPGETVSWFKRTKLESVRKSGFLLSKSSVYLFRNAVGKDWQDSKIWS